MDQYARIETAKVFACVYCFLTADCCTGSYNEACFCKQCFRVLYFILVCRSYLCISAYMWLYLYISVYIREHLNIWSESNNGFKLKTRTRSGCSSKVLSLLSNTLQREIAWSSRSDGMVWGPDHTAAQEFKLMKKRPGPCWLRLPSRCPILARHPSGCCRHYVRLGSMLPSCSS